MTTTKEKDIDTKAESKDKVFEALLFESWKKDISDSASRKVIEWRKRYGRAE